jgi:hypothetical protein
MKKRNFALFGVMLLAVAALLQYEKQQYSLHKGSAFKHAIKKQHPLPQPQEKKPQGKSEGEETAEQRALRLQEFNRKLDLANEQAGYGRIEQIDNSKPPRKRLIKLKSGEELVELTFEHGGKTYLPNDERYDVATGKLLPKELK